MRRFWPTGLTGRILLVLFAAILLEHVGDAVLFEWGLVEGPGHLPIGELLSTVILTASVYGAAALAIRELGAPLRSLARSVDQIGGLAPVPIDLVGPREVREVAATVNAMQDRIARLVADRTQALAAVSHDLRTPIARLRLCADDIADPALRAALVESVDDMQHMVDSVLTYLAGETDREQPRPVDLAQLLATQADAAADAGHDVRYEGPDHVRVLLRLFGIKRATDNLITNAIKYGGGAVIGLVIEPGLAVIRIDDDGPGIPETELQRAFEPFIRLDPARSDTGGVGLGLAIALHAARREGGNVKLSNRLGGGLRAELMLPLP